MADRLGGNPLDFIGANKQKEQKKTPRKQRKAQTEPKAEGWADKGCKMGYTRAMLFIGKDNLKKLKDLAYWDRKQIKEVLEEALDKYFKGKTIKPRPKD